MIKTSIMKSTITSVAFFVAVSLTAPTATAIPAAAGETALPTAKLIFGTFDGKMVRDSRNRTFTFSHFMHGLA
tara:strand:- start:3830 stop:4048 length:219 start_codon:yes stop_codon:yes gene_type:complete